MRNTLRRFGLPLLLAGVLVSSPASATEQKMDPKMMDAMIRAMFNTMIEVMVSPNVAKMYATYVRTFYTELVKQGFSEDEAFRLCLSHSPLQLQSK